MNKSTKLQYYSNAYRTTVPLVIARYLEVKAGDSIQYNILQNGNITITKVKEQN